MHNLIAYIPVLNQLYINWLEKHRGSRLFLISNSLAESLLPRLSRNMGAVATELVARTILSERLASQVEILEPCPGLNPNFRYWVYYLPDEDVCHLLADKCLGPERGIFEPVWGRWDMTAVKRKEPVIPDLEVSSAEIDLLRMEAAKKLRQKSPDWWRQITALAFRGEELLAAACNGHYPNEYEVAIFGDPRINFDAGDQAGAEVYLSLHAERGIVCYSGRKGVPLEGASLYVTEFPCPDCTRWIVAAGFTEVFFDGGYSILGGLRTLQAAGIRVVKVKSPEPA